MPLRSLSFSSFSEKRRGERNIELRFDLKFDSISIDLIQSLAEMVRKKVPEWLNSTMWSAPPPPSSFNDDDGLLLHSPAAKMKEEQESESIFVASRLNPAPPPSTASPRHRNNGSNIISGVVPSAEDFSRQAHLSVEVNCANLHSFINLYLNC